MTSRVGQNLIYTPYMTAYMVMSLPKIPYVNCIYIFIYIWFWPTLMIRLCVAGIAGNIRSIWFKYTFRQLHAHPVHTRIHTYTRTQYMPVCQCKVPVCRSESMSRVGQNHIYTVHVRCFWQGNHQIYGYIRCLFTVLPNYKHVQTSTCHLNKQLLPSTPSQRNIGTR
jgi:hypothetical protein